MIPGIDCIQDVSPQAPYLQELFPEQLRFVLDTSRRRSLRTTRRAGKTRVEATDIVHTMECFPGQWTYYLTPRLTQSRRNIEPTIKQLIHRYGLPIGRLMEDGQLYYRHANGHTLWIAGCKDQREADKYRGDACRKLVIDEAGAWPGDLIEYLVTESAGPAMSDHDGVIDIVGTPPPIPVGFWYEVDTGDGHRKQYSAHRWSVLDNPHHRYYRRPDLLQLELDENYGGDPSNPAFLREWHGDWVADLNALCYHYDPQKNELRRGLDGKPELPDALPHEWFYALGIDVGYHDSTTFTVSASRRGFRDIFLLESYGTGKLLLPQIAAEILRLKQRYRFNSIVMDTAGGAKVLCETINAQWKMAITPANKREKSVRIRNMQSGLVGGWVHVEPIGCSQLLGEWATLAWNEDHSDHDERCADDCSDGALYSVGAHPAHEVWEENPPVPGTTEWVNAQMEDYKRRRIERIKAGKRRKSGRAEFA